MDFSSKPQDKLDNDFRRILCVIKESIQYVNSNYQLSLYRSWLEKLSTANDEKVERNMYLLELARQIESNKLLPPFDHHPPSGSLRSLPKISLFRPSDIENLCHSLQNIDNEYANFLHHEQIPPVKDSYLHESFQNDIHTLFAQPPECYYHPCYAEDGSDTPVGRTKTPTKTKKRKSNSTRSLQKLPVTDNSLKSIADRCEKQVGRTDRQRIHAESIPEKESSVKDDSSWCDLTDTSQTSISIMASGDNGKSPPKVQEKVKQFNCISKTLEHPEIPDQNKEPRRDFCKKNQLNLSDKAEKIGHKVQNWNEMKISLKDTNFISSDWKKTIEGLQLRLTETLSQNNELKSIINTLQLKLKGETSKNKEQSDANQKKCELRKRDIEALQQIQAENVKKLEKSFQAKLGEAERGYQLKIEKFKANYEMRIREMHSKQELTKKEKDQEMRRLSEVIQQQCIRISNEIAALRIQIENAFSSHNSGEKIVVLQKCVSKMDKLFHRSEKEYQKHIDKLRQELDLKDKVMQIQLKTQRAELIARTSVEKQKQFDEVINNLEVKYIRMLEFHESQVVETKGRDQEKIEHLKHLLDENNIHYDNLL